MRKKSEVSLCGNLIDIKYQIPFYFYFFFLYFLAFVFHFGENVSYFVYDIIL